MSRDTPLSPSLVAPLRSRITLSVRPVSASAISKPRARERTSTRMATENPTASTVSAVAVFRTARLLRW